MYNPIRGGTRGGQGDFTWAEVSADKDRENYLGHSINAPTGRWQKNKDIHWYKRDVANSESDRLEEIRKIKEAEADALAVALGFKSTAKTGASGESSIKNPNLIPVAPKPRPPPDEETQKGETKGDKESLKEGRRAAKEERRARKERERAERGSSYHRREDSYSRRSREPSHLPPRRDRPDHWSRSPSPRPRYSRSRSPAPRDSRPPRRRSHSPRRQRSRSPPPRYRSSLDNAPSRRRL